jgi:FtsH-binding integral membrane protein
MNDPALTPPIASPFGAGSPSTAPVQVTRSWSEAPKILRHWVYPLLWLQIFSSILGMAISLLTDPLEESIVVAILAAIFIGLCFWLMRALKRGAPAAWTILFWLAIIGLLGFPIGTAISYYVLSKWSLPGTKAWFSRR